MRRRRHLPRRPGGLDRQAGFGAAGLLAAVLAAAGIAVLVLVLWPETPPPALEVLSSRQCLECHPGVAAEWEASQHRQAFVNPAVRQLSQDFRNEECLACHAPRPVLAFEPGARVLARQSERGLGVDCLACHQAPAGGVATTDPAPNRTAACRPATEPRMAAVEHCGSCHNQHGTVDQWAASDPELKGTGCLDCHMPVAWRKGGRSGRDHRMWGGHHPETVRSAVVLEGSWDGAAAAVRVTNVGAAHNFPTDERSRAADVQVRWRSGEAWSTWEHVWRMRDPYRDEVDLTNTQLPSRETWSTRLEPPEGATAGEARLLYRTNPFQPDEESLEVHRITLER